MNRDEILNVLLEREGGVNPDRGVGGDDILLARWADMDEAGHSVFWPNFCHAVAALWRELATEALEVAAAFVAGIGLESKPSDSLLEPLRFLLDDSDIKAGALVSGEGRRRTVAALRLLSKLGLGDRDWWRNRFWNWIDEAPKATGEDGMLAWQAVLHASMGLLQAGQMDPRVDTWIETARKAEVFPAIELFTMLARQTPHQADTADFVHAVVEAFQSLSTNCGMEGACPQTIEDIRMVIESWLSDPVVGRKPKEAVELLQWKEPDKLLPQERYFSHRQASDHVHS